MKIFCRSCGRHLTEPEIAIVLNELHISFGEDHEVRKSLYELVSTLAGDSKYMKECTHISCGQNDLYLD
jgi:hypothetical protein